MVHNNGINSGSSHNGPESIEFTHHISISDHEQALVHTVLTLLFTILGNIYLKVLSMNGPSSTVSCDDFPKISTVFWGNIFLELLVLTKQTRKPGALVLITEI